MEEVTTPTPEGAATTAVAETKPETQAPARGPDGKFVQASPAEVPSATTEPAAEPEAPKDDEPKRSRASERINQLTAEKHAALREAAMLRSKLEALQQAPRPQIDPNDFEAQQRESVRGVFREETAHQTYQQYETAVRKAQEAQSEAWKTKIEAARERIPDIDRSVHEFVTRLPCSEHAAEIIAESDLAAEITHYLAQNPREAFDLYHMTPAQQGRALAKIEQRLSLPARRVSTAPPPPPTVTAAQAARARSPSEMSAAEYVAMRKQEWAKGGR